MTRFLVAALLGLTVGLAGGLAYAWIISPDQGPDAAPAALSADEQMEYLRLAAQAFAAEGDLERARARLAALGQGDPVRLAAAQAQRLAAAGGDLADLQMLAQMAAALGARPATPTLDIRATATALAAPGAPTRAAIPASETPAPATEPTPAAAPTLPPLAGYQLLERSLVCDAKQTVPLIQVLAVDLEDRPLPGLEVIVEWAGGFDHFFTGLKPELGPGYGDFAMAPGVAYTLRLADHPGVTVEGVVMETCVDPGGASFPGSWQFTFQGPALP